ncbi:MAG: hypothetical protein AAB447_00590 [Patescibacteria group bacterium]
MTRQFVRSQKTGRLVSPEQALEEEREMRTNASRYNTIRMVGVILAWMVVVGGVISTILK